MFTNALGDFMNKKINPNTYVTTLRHDKFIEQMLQEYMEKQDCDKSTAVREILQYFMELGGTSLITN